ncbi:MAG: YegS/Rv2252/BmrU family lipid kinase [Chitinophagales bacterium]|nr:YegS/Rv2252/BmrU family lipid kinase [Chitinophagales bacterium]
MTTRKIALIANLASKNHSDQSKFDAFVFDKLEENEIEIAFYKTNSLQNLEKVVRLGLQNHITEFVTIGGDGSLHHLVNQLFRHAPDISQIKIAVLPKGTGNDYIRNFNFQSKREILDTLLKSSYKAIDIGQLNFDAYTKYFINMLGIGFSAAVVKKLNRYKWLGGISYYLALVDTFFSYQSDMIHLIIDGKEQIYDCFQLSVGNGKYAGNGMKLCPEAITDDGFFEVNIIRKISLWKLLRYMHTLKDGSYLNYISSLTLRAQTITILDSSSLHCEADGEEIPMPKEIAILPQIVKMPVG